MYFKINPTGCAETMREITDITLIDRTTKRVSYADGKKEYHCRGPQNTIAYFDGSGVLRDQDVTFGEETYSKSVSGLWLKKKNSVSVGVRLDGVLSKYLGMRPDVCQDGSEQLEFSIENIKINGKTVSVSLPSAVARVNSTLDKYGDLIRVFPYRQGCRQLVKADGNTKSISITYRLHLTGLELVSNDLGEFWFASKKTGIVRFRLRKPVLCDINTLEPLFLDEFQTESTAKLLTHSLKLQPDCTYLYTKESVADLSLHKLPPEYYVDADTVYSTTADAQMTGPTSSVWSDARGAESASSIDSTSAYTPGSGGVYYYSPNWKFYRSLFYYDLASISEVCTGAKFYFWGYFSSGGVMCLQQGTQGNPATIADFDSFSGLYWGTVTLSTSSYAYLSANSAGLTAVNNSLGATLLVMGREYGNDYLDVQVAANNYFGLFYTDYTSTTRDPYVSLEAATGHPTRKRHAGNPFSPFRKGVW